MKIFLPDARALLVATWLATAACGENSRGSPRETMQEPSPVRPPASEHTYALWVEATGLDASTVRLSFNDQKAVDVRGDGRVLVSEDLAPGTPYSVWINKKPEQLRCALFVAGAPNQGETPVKGHIAESDVVLELACVPDDVRLAKLSLFTPDARMVPTFDPATLAYALEGHYVNDRVEIDIAAADPRTNLRARLDGHELELGPAPFELSVEPGVHHLEFELTAPSGRVQRYVADVSRAEERQAQTLYLPGTADPDAVIERLATSADYLAAATPWAGGGAGRVDVFRRTPDGWLHDTTLVPTLAASGAPANDHKQFGGSLALADDWLAVTVGVHADGEEDPIQGRAVVVVFQRASGAWVERQRLEPRDPEAAGDTLEVAMRGDLLAVGNIPPRAFDRSGGVEIYRLGADGTWSWKQGLRGDGLAQDAFGSTLAVDDTHLAVAAPSEALEPDDPEIPNEILSGTRGSVYLFAIGATELTPDGKVSYPSQSVRGGRFGNVLALQDGLLAVGTEDESSEPPTIEAPEEHDGAVYLFHRGSKGWSLASRIPAQQQSPPPGPWAREPARFGRSLAFTADALWVGAVSDSLPEGPWNGGVVYRDEIGKDGMITGSPLLVPLVPTEREAGLGAALSSSHDGVVAVSEPNMLVPGNNINGAIHLLY